MIVLDTSAAVEILLRTPSGLLIEHRIFRPGETLHAPHLIDAEVAQVLRRLSRQRIDPAVARIALANWSMFPVQRYSHEILLNRAWELRANFSIYDALYIALAEILGAPLVTHDAKLVSPVHTATVEVI